MSKRLSIPSVLVLCLAACGGAEDKNDDATPCITNASVACACPGGAAGAQICQADGTFSPCACPCDPGFEYTAAGCVDIDECTTGMNTCHPDATCVNLYGDYLCRCDGSFTGDGQHCDLDECHAGTDDCDPLATCTDLDPGFACTCPAGYAGDGTTCTDIDECRDGLDDCVANAGCANLPGTFSCACLEGFRHVGSACVNIDECGEGLDTCAAADGVVCVDASPGFTCVCAEGYLGDGITCTPDAATMVRDISDRPVSLAITGIGAVTVAGLSRVGWDIEVIETPTLEGRTHKDAGLVTVPDITLRNLTGTPTIVSALITWAQQGSAAPVRTATLGLEGLGGETASVTLTDLRPVSVNSATVPSGANVTLAELVIRLPDPNSRGSLPVALANWTQPSWGGGYPICTRPGQELEIMGVAEALCYPLGVLDVPAVDSSGPLYLPAVRGGDVMHTWARTVANQCLADPTTDFGRRAMSVINCSGTGTGCGASGNGSETSRVNIFEIFPATFDYFDPTRPYGYEYLFNLLIVDDWVEQA